MYTMYRPDGTVFMTGETDEECWCSLLPAIPNKDFDVDSFFDLMERLGWTVVEWKDK